MLALAQSAEAKIVYTKTHVVIGRNNIYELDLNHDGLADFKIDNHSFFTDTIVATLSAFPAQANNRSRRRPAADRIPVLRLCPQAWGDRRPQTTVFRRVDGLVRRR